jgi:hypothetical protein
LADFDANWERCKPYLAPAVDEAWTIDAVEQEIRAGRATLWPMANSAAVTVIQEMPNGRELLVWLAGGELDELLHFLPSAGNYGKSVGCKRVRIEGRPGWERVLTGYTRKRVVLIKDLSDE